MSHRALGQQFAAVKDKAYDVGMGMARVGFYVKAVAATRPTDWHDDPNPILRRLSSPPPR